MKKLRTSNSKEQDCDFTKCLIYVFIFLNTGKFNFYYFFFPPVLLFASSFTYLLEDRIK